MKLALCLLFLLGIADGQNNACRWECSRNPNGSTCRACQGQKPDDDNFVNRSPIQVASIANHPESVLMYGSTLWVSDMGADTSDIQNGDGNLLKFPMKGKEIIHLLLSPPFTLQWEWP